MTNEPLTRESGLHEVLLDFTYKAIPKQPNKLTKYAHKYLKKLDKKVHISRISKEEPPSTAPHVKLRLSVVQTMDEETYEITEEERAFLRNY